MEAEWNKARFYNKNSNVQYLKIVEIVKEQGGIEILGEYILQEKQNSTLNRTPNKLLLELIQN